MDVNMESSKTTLPEPNVDTIFSTHAFDFDWQAKQELTLGANMVEKMTAPAQSPQISAPDNNQTVEEVNPLDNGVTENNIDTPKAAEPAESIEDEVEAPKAEETVSTEAIEAGKKAAEELAKRALDNHQTADPKSSVEPTEPVNDKAGAEQQKSPEPAPKKSDKDQPNSKEQQNKLLDATAGRSLASFAKNISQTKQTKESLTPRASAEERTLKKFSDKTQKLDQSIQEFNETVKSITPGELGEQLKMKEEKLSKIARDVGRHTEELKSTIASPSGRQALKSAPELSKAKESLENVTEMFSAENLKNLSLTGSQGKIGNIANKASESAKAAIENANKLVSSLSQSIGISRG